MQTRSKLRLPLLLALVSGLLYVAAPGCTTGLDDDDTTSPPGDDDTSPTSPTPTANTIASLNQNPPPDNTVVSAEGIVTGITFKGDFWISDPAGGLWTGIYVFDEYVKRGVTAGIAVGDKVKVTAPFKFFYGVRELVIYEDSGTVELLQAGAGLPPPVVLTDLSALKVSNVCDADQTTAFDPYMGTYLQLPEGVVSAAAGACATDAKYGLWELTVGTDKVLVDDDTDPNYDPYLDDQVVIHGMLFFTDYSNVGNYKILPTSVEVEGSTQPTPNPNQTIQDLNQHPPADNSQVEVTGIVTSIDAKKNFTIEDEAGGEWSGMYIFDEKNKKGEAAGAVVGDKVKVLGVFKTYYGLREIQVYQEAEKGAVTIVQKAAGVPAAFEVSDLNVFTFTDMCNTAVDAKAEPYVSMLVKVSSMTVAQAKGVCDSTNDTGVWTVKDSSGDKLLVDDSFSYSYVPKVDDVVSVSGIITYSFSKYKMLPRGDADIVKQ